VIPRTPLLALFVSLLLLGLPQAGSSWTPVPVKEDPLVRMPGTQPEQLVGTESPGRCLNCHGGYNASVEPGHNWKGSMMAQAARDFLYWSCLAVAAQDSIAAAGRPNATDICLRCHMGKGWLEGRSDPTNGSAMVGADFDGVQCDFCHQAWDPFFEDTYTGNRAGEHGFWDETNLTSPGSSSSATLTYNEDDLLAQAIKLFDGGDFFTAANLPASAAYTEAGAGQYFISPGSEKRASFADDVARHQSLYSRHHKSRFFCSTCHDVSNPVLQNLGHSGPGPLPTETDPAFGYFHVERTFSEFRLSAYGTGSGSAGIGPFSPGSFETSHPDNLISKCQDCHMRDVVGRGCNKKGAPIRPTDSREHPESGLPLHDMTGGNAWVSYVLASAVSGSPNYDAVNAQLLNQGPSVLTLDMAAGLGIDAPALLDGVERSKQQLELAAAIENLTYDPLTGTLAFRVQNQTGHKLISGFPEGRRMFVNVQAYAGTTLLYEANPYDAAAGTLKGLTFPYHDPDNVLPNPAALGAGEAYVDALVYEMHPSSTLTGEQKTFHFALADGRYKDNRIPPMGFRIAEAAARLCVPVWHGVEDPNYYTALEYAGGYDDVSMAIPAGADRVEVALYYQTTSREYIEFLRDEIDGYPGRSQHMTLASTAYIAQTDPFFARLRAWGGTMWDLWTHNMDVPGAAPYQMAGASWGNAPVPECTPAGWTTGGLESLSAGKNRITVRWSDAHNANPDVTGYNIYYDQSGKAQLAAGVGLTTSYTDSGLVGGQSYCYKVTVVEGTGCESDFSNVLCETAGGGGGKGGGGGGKGKK
jgi:hypothetical protein